MDVAEGRGLMEGVLGDARPRHGWPAARRWAARALGLSRLALRVGVGLLVVVLAAGCWPYLLTPEYRFQAPVPFSGPHLYNPYAGGTGRWWKANFHAHSHAWDGITNGHQPPARVVRAYRSLGYDIAAVSNYQSIWGAGRKDPDFLPVYEHGYNVRKVHELVIGARRVTWLDFPLGQTRSDRQYMLDRLDAAGGVVAIAHPWLRDGYSAKDLRYLTDYNVMEVIRRGHAGVDRWDAALSAGHRSWIIGDDDEHNLNRPGDVGVSWTMIQAPSLRRSDILAALRAGHTYGVQGRRGHNDVLLRSLALRGDTLVVRTDPGATAFRFIGQDGAVHKIVHDPMQARYVVQPKDTYVRVEIVTPHTRMYLNPVFRYAHTALAQPVATLDMQRTWRARAWLLMALLLVAARVWFVRAGARRPVPGGRKLAGEAVSAD